MASGGLDTDGLGQAWTWHMCMAHMYHWTLVRAHGRQAGITALGRLTTCTHPFTQTAILV